MTRAQGAQLARKTKKPKIQLPKPHVFGWKSGFTHFLEEFRKDCGKFLDDYPTDKEIEDIARKVFKEAIKANTHDLPNGQGRRPCHLYYLYRLNGKRFIFVYRFNEADQNYSPVTVLENHFNNQEKVKI